MISSLSLTFRVLRVLNTKHSPVARGYSLLLDWLLSLTSQTCLRMRKHGWYLWRLATIFREGGIVEQRCRFDNLVCCLCHEISVMSHSAPTKSSGRGMRMLCHVSSIWSWPSWQRLGKTLLWWIAPMEKPAYVFQSYLPWLPLMPSIQHCTKWVVSNAHSMRFWTENLVRIQGTYTSHTAMPIMCKRHGIQGNSRHLSHRVFSSN